MRSKRASGFCVGVASALRRPRLNRPNVVPYRVYGIPLHLVQVPFEARDRSRALLHHQSLLIRLLHPFLCPSPDSRHSEKLICQVRAVLIRVYQVSKLVAPSRFRLDMAIKLVNVCRIVWPERANPREVITLTVVQKEVGIVRISLESQALRVCPTPGYFAAKLFRSKYRIHKRFEVVARSRVAVKVDASRVLQYATHLQETDGHHAEIGLHPLAVRKSCRLYGAIDGRMLIGDEAHPRHVEVAERPRVLEGRARRPAADGGSVVAVRVERRVEIDQVDRLGVQAPQDVEVVTRPYRLVYEVVWHGRMLPQMRTDVYNLSPVRRGRDTERGYIRNSHQLYRRHTLPYTILTTFYSPLPFAPKVHLSYTTPVGTRHQAPSAPTRKAHETHREEKERFSGSEKNSQTVSFRRSCARSAPCPPRPEP